jgi:hypothetical protein
MGKGTLANIGEISMMGEVGKLGDEAGDLSDLSQLVVGDTIDSHFQLEVRDDGTEIGIAASFSVSINGAMDHLDAFLDC